MRNALHRRTLPRTPALALLLTIALPIVDGRGQEATARHEPPTWGRIDTGAERLGRHVFMIERRPENGRVAVPAGFPQIVRARLFAGDDRRDESGAKDRTVNGTFASDSRATVGR